LPKSTTSSIQSTFQQSKQLSNNSEGLDVKLLAGKATSGNIDCNGFPLNKHKHTTSSSSANLNYNPGQVSTIKRKTLYSSTTFKNSTKKITSRIIEQPQDYNAITSDLRVKLLQMIEEEGVLIKDASNKLKINY
jgi:hypothetical protein